MLSHAAEQLQTMLRELQRAEVRIQELVYIYHMTCILLLI